MKTEWNRPAILVLTLMAMAFATWNVADEAKVMGGDPLNALVTVALWMVVPCLVALMGVLSKNVTKTRVCLVLSVVYAAVFLLYAVNGSSLDHGEGAQHLHLVLVPFLLPFLSIVVLCALYLLHLARRFATWRKSKRTCKE